MSSSQAKGKPLKRARQPDSRRHHFVPAGYIGFFAEPQGRDGRIHVWDVVRAKGWLSTPDKVAWETDFYRLDPGDPPHAVEDTLADAEGRIIAAIREISASPLAIPTEAQTGAVVSLVALQHVRGPELRTEFVGFFERLARLSLEVSTSKPATYEAQVRRLLAADPTKRREDFPTCEEARTAFKDENLQFGLNNGFTVSALLRMQRTVFELISRMELTFLWATEGEELVTSNRPVVLVPRAGPPLIGPGIATAEAITMPLTPTVLFMARPLEHAVVARRAPPGFVDKVNRWVTRQAEQVYSRRQFAPLQSGAGKGEGVVD